jgi:hypothetical protein
VIHVTSSVAERGPGCAGVTSQIETVDASAHPAAEPRLRAVV